jgi:hypothetical protein
MDGDPMSIPIKAVATDAAPQAFGHYALATEAGGVVYVSGQLAARADGASLADQPFEVQARQALANIVAIVEGAGLAVIVSQKSPPISSVSNTGRHSTRSMPRSWAITVRRARWCRYRRCIMAT